MNHIQPLRLFDLVQAEIKKSKFSLEDWEQAHLQDCTECRECVESFSRQFKPKASGADDSGATAKQS